MFSEQIYSLITPSLLPHYSLKMSHQICIALMWLFRTQVMDIGERHLNYLVFNLKYRNIKAVFLAVLNHSRYACPHHLYQLSVIALMSNIWITKH